MTEVNLANGGLYLPSHEAIVCSLWRCPLDDDVWSSARDGVTLAELGAPRRLP